jgi:hypothetical protein
VTPTSGDVLNLSWQTTSPYLLAGWPENAGATTTNVDNIEAGL